MKPATRPAACLPSPLETLYAVVDAKGALVQLDFEGGRSAPRDRKDLERRRNERGIELGWNAERKAAEISSLESFYRHRS